jgi:ATP-dependent DNA ligase
MPGFIKPQLATLKAKTPKGEQWIHEIKYDGYRVQVHLNSGRKKVFTRNGLDWTKRFTEIAGALAIPAKPSSTGRSWSSMRAAPASRNCRPNWQGAGRGT